MAQTLGPAHLLQRLRHQVVEVLFGNAGRQGGQAGEVGLRLRTVGILGEEAETLQMGRRRNGQGQRVADGLVEARIGAVAEDPVQVPVPHKVLDVAHFVVHRHQVLLVDRRAHLDPVVDDVTALLPSFWQHRYS